MSRKKLESVSEAAKTTPENTSAVSSDDVSTMKAMLAGGKTLREIAAACGLSHVTVRSKLIKVKAKMRKPGRKRFIGGVALSKMIRAGSTRAEMAEEFGVSESTISRAILRLQAK